MIEPSSIRPPPRPFFNSPIIIYLRRRRRYRDQETHLNLLPSLALSSNATVVRVSYRLSNSIRYPQPIHDVLAAYDWIRSHLGQSTPEANQERKIGVCGELIGGSLAAMLALTECHTDRQSISAAVLGNPVSDWTALFSEMPSKPSANLRRLPSSKGLTPMRLLDKASNPTIDSFLKIRDTIFPQPVKYYDPFASPSLFFRTPSVDLPPEPAPRDNPRTPFESSSSSEHIVPELEVEPLVKKRRSYRKHLEGNSNFRMPRIRVELGKEHVLHDQGMELAHLMRRSALLSKRTEMAAGAEGGALDAEDRIELLEREGLGGWGEKEADEIGRWFAKVLS